MCVCAYIYICTHTCKGRHRTSDGIQINMLRNLFPDYRSYCRNNVVVAIPSISTSLCSLRGGPKLRGNRKRDKGSRLKGNKRCRGNSGLLLENLDEATNMVKA